MAPSFAWRIWPLRIAAAIAAVALLLGLQTLLARSLNEYYQQIIILAGVNIILAVSLTLINGITGQFSLGHAGFMAVGAYAAACFTFYAGPRLILLDTVVFLIALAIAAFVSGLAGWLVGLPSLRLRGDYLAIVTLGFNQIIIVIITTINEVGGARGFVDLPPMTSFAWVYGLVILCILTVRNLADSDLGRSMRAVREDEIAAEAVGVNTTRIKVLAFVVSSMWAGVAGALQAHYIQSAHPGSFTFVKSVEVVVMVVLGGLGSITGATVTAVVLTVLVEVLRTISGAFWVGLGLILLAAALALPQYRPRLRQSIASWIQWLSWPVLSTAALILLFHFGREELEQRRDALRYVIYALILIVLMLLRPQGLLGRGEFGWHLMRRRAVTNEAVTNEPESNLSAGRAGGEVTQAQTEPADEAVEGSIKS